MAERIPPTAIVFLTNLPALAVTALLAFLFQQFTAFQGEILPFPLRLLFETVFLLQLLIAWQDKGRITLAHLYALISLYFFRLIFFASGEGSHLWGLRAGLIQYPTLDLLAYLLGIVCLHPSVHDWIQEKVSTFRFSSNGARVVVILSFFILLGFLFTTYSSRYITRDGMDWIQRSMRPVWHLYLREPLTIGLYRAAYLILNEIMIVSSYAVISGLSIIAGLWTVAWFGLWLQQTFAIVQDRLLAAILFSASGGLVVLFFGHVEVYPILIAGLMPAFYFAQGYMNGKTRIEWAAFCLGIAFILHLSTGWLLPAFFLLPFLAKPRREAPFDLLRLILVFGIIQLFFWVFIILHGYEGSVTAFWERLHHDFTVGPDQAMFLPQQSIFHPLHLYDLFNEYLYLSIPCCLLLPLFLYALMKNRSKQMFFYLLCAGFYFIYTFTWNPDRGFPEDWDLFSPFALLLVLTQSFILLSSKQNGSENRLHLHEPIYLITLGCLPFALLQIAYHYIHFFALSPF